MEANAQNNLQLNEDNLIFSFMQEAAKIGSWEVDLIDNTIFWSKVTKEIHEVESDYMPILEEGINFYKEGENRERITKLFNNCIETGEKFDGEFQIITSKGKEKWVRSIGAAVFDKNDSCVKVHGIFQDIHEKTKASKKLALNEERFRKIFEYAANGMALVDLDGTWLQVNDTLCEMIGYTSEEFLKLTFQDITHPDDLYSDVSLLQEMLINERDSYKIEKRYFHKNGSIIWALLSVSLVKNSKGKPQYFVSQINNITERKKTEVKNKSLLEVTKDQNMRLLNFAHIVSHNLRSHSGNLEMLLNLMEMDLPESTENEFFPMLKTAVDHLQETIENLNEVAVVNTKTTENLTTLSLSHYIEKSIDSIKPQILENNATFKNNADKNINIKGIPAYLDSIFLNFFTNALKYKSPERTPLITINTEIKDEFVQVKIEDNGLGIDLKTYGEKLFGMYKTFHQHKDARGLGLFITKNQVEAIGGKIEVLSKINKGTTFIIYLQHEKN
ncbi:PAS domain-containing sensor histidine kinase [Marixanthomonas ophiurae]|uniref:histidine kinase n=1 Tax=Marixanthomonas ophiurae TaxID=387659 RepID=A0A3E1QB36_9FLAO|nr:PAS domain-containing sensor histidine kinase [Marixanthomonas ophiurae]RFN59350.1 PAS domain S-box protein [Marixanthomonas ophiurae]